MKGSEDNSSIVKFLTLLYTLPSPLFNCFLLRKERNERIKERVDNSVVSLIVTHFKLVETILIHKQLVYL